MSIFDFNPLEVGNSMTLGMTEESLVDDIRQLAALSRNGCSVYTTDIHNLLNSYGVNYMNLSQWVKNEIDKIALVD